MKGALSLPLLFFFSLVAGALPPLEHDRFRAELEVRRLEELLRLTEARPEAYPGENSSELRKLSAELTQAKIERNGVIKEQAAESRRPASEGAGLPSLSPSMLRAFSALEWQILSELYGAQTQEALLEKTFGQAPKPQPPLHEKPIVLWLSTPTFPLASRKANREAEDARKAALLQLQKLGYRTEQISASPFPHMEDVADDIQKILQNRKDQAPAVLVTEGEASAALLRTFDLYPSLAKQENLRGWINVNGRLFGPSSRAPASTTKFSAADRQQQEAREEERKLSQDRLVRPMPIGASFPVLSLVTTKGKERPANNLRESIVPDGKALFLQKGNGHAELKEALERLTSR